MKEIVLTAGAAVASWLVVTALFGALFGIRVGVEILAGMIGPLFAASVTWVLVERTYSLNAERLTGLMVAAFACKLVFFGGYVAFALKVLSLRPVPFMLSFTGYFIALYLMAALYMRRLFSGGTRALQ